MGMHGAKSSSAEEVCSDLELLVTRLWAARQNSVRDCKDVKLVMTLKLYVMDLVRVCG
jgi:hypothetical protein